MEAEEGILIGSYSQPNTNGIYINASTIKATNPSFLLLNPPFLYAVSETDDSSITSFQFSGQYKVQNQLSTQGRSACHISIDRSKRYLFVTNYSSGTVAVYLLDANGALLKLINFLVHDGPSGVVPDRQQAPHPHSSICSQDNKTLFVADLGTDYVYWYNLDAENSNVKMDEAKSIRLLGYGPRHMALAPSNDKIMFLACELNQKIVVLSTNDKLQSLYEVTTSANSNTYLSQIKYFTFSTKQFVGVASRGDNELILYQLSRNGKDTSLKEQTRKKVYDWPRHFNVSSDGSRVIVSNQKGNIVSQYSFNGQQLADTSQKAIATPSFVQYF